MLKDILNLSCLISCQTNLDIWRNQTSGFRKPPLRPDADSYALYMAEQDGSIDVEFPALDMSEPLTKYGFEILGYDPTLI